MFLVRFDDVCPTMNWEIWDQIEPVLRKFNIKPILAVIPDNRDETFHYCEARTDFWDRVRQWQEWNWAIGIHGFQHVYVTEDAGILGRAPYSEFAGLGYKEQKNKLEKAIAIFRREKIESRLWIAPAHTFDETTLQILKELDVKTISDGISFRPYIDPNGLTWVPVQVARFRSIYSFCICTVCLHHNQWTWRELNRFRHDIARFLPHIKSLDDVLSRYGERRHSFTDVAFKQAYKYALCARQVQHRLVASWWQSRHVI
jgi:hypothetical protein